jgi:hypothetical protein
MSVTNAPTTETDVHGQFAMRGGHKALVVVGASIITVIGFAVLAAGNLIDSFTGSGLGVIIGFAVIVAGALSGYFTLFSSTDRPQLTVIYNGIISALTLLLLLIVGGTTAMELWIFSGGLIGLGTVLHYVRLHQAGRM